MIQLLCWECGYTTNPGSVALKEALEHQQNTEKVGDVHDSWRAMEIGSLFA